MNTEWVFYCSRHVMKYKLQRTKPLVKLYGNTADFIQVTSIHWRQCHAEGLDTHIFVFINSQPLDLFIY